MKKISCILLLLSGVVFAQNFQGKAVYKTHRKMNKMKITSNGKESSKQNKKLKDMIKKLFQKTYELEFNTKESVYKQRAELDKPQASGGKITSISFSSIKASDVLYKNLSAKNYISQKEIGGKRFLIQDKLPDYPWEMSSETKKIGKYTCYKATKSREVTRKSFMTVDGKEQETEKKETVVTTAWYTPEIPISSGPDMYGGLPGLILELHEGKKTIVCVEVVINPKEIIEIKKPNRGKKVSQKTYDKIMDKYSKETLQRFRTRRRPKSKNTQSISVQL